jgi:hypothetical protein
MRGLVFITAAMVVAGCNSSFAQQVRSTVNTRPGIALGTINTGAMGGVTGGRIGSITSCTTPGSTGTPNTLFNATIADPLLGTLPPPVLPGATLPAAPPFGGSTMSGTCDPTASTSTIIEDLGSSVAVTIPGLAAITGPTYLDATMPPTATEAGGTGQSPQIIVPTPAVPSASPCIGTATLPLTVITDPTALMATGSAVAMSSGMTSANGMTSPSSVTSPGSVTSASGC